MSTFRQKFQATTNWVKPDPEDQVEAPRKARRKRRAAAPVTAHRLFPAFAAVWVAALLGLGSLAIPGSLLGALVLKTGLPALVPAAAPPLGFTAHLLVAFTLAAFGGALGLALALRLRPEGRAEPRRPAPVVPATAPEPDAVYKVRARDAHPDAPPRRPLVVTEALVDPLVEESFGPEPEPAVSLLRRKRPASGEPEGDASTPWIPDYTPGDTAAVRPLDLSALDLDEPIDAPRFAEQEPVVIAAAEAPAEPAPQPEPQPEQAAIAETPVLLAATPQLPVGFAAALPDAAEVRRSPVAGAPLESLGLVQLIERLALAIAEQKAGNEAVIAADNASEAVAAEAGAAEPGSEPGPFSQPHRAGPAAQASDVAAIGSPREAILRRLGAIAAGEPLNEADSAASARLFTRPVQVPASAPASAPVSADAVVPLRPVEPTAPPLSLAASAPTALVEADEALRSALATLQRMSARA